MILRGMAIQDCSLRHPAAALWCTGGRSSGDFSLNPAVLGPSFPTTSATWLILTGKNGTPIHVLRLNETEMAWEKMESLGSRALFTGTAPSLSMAKPPPEVLWAYAGNRSELTNSGGRLFFVAKAKQQGSSDKAGDGDGAWCYDLELDSARVGKPFKNLLQYVWVHLGLASEMSGDAMDIG